jgi:RNA polymerase sigma factor (sigma-70 family)
MINRLDTLLMDRHAMNQEIDLIAASQAGDRQAFGELVRQHQRLVCALAFSGLGDVTQSEDVAQEVFLAAWTNLHRFQPGSNFRAWLCGIARNLTQNLVRRRRRDAVHEAEPLENSDAIASPLPGPVGEAISREERDLLWRCLARIPETYREPMVLFYRDGRSVETVAATLGLSEDAVKQRLSRGRRMLHDRMAGFVESALGRSGPGEAFTLAVLAALPALSSTAAASVSAAAVKTTTAGKSVAASGLLGAVVGPIVGVLSAYLSCRIILERCRTPRERAFAVRWIRALLSVWIGFSLGLLALILYGYRLSTAHPVWYVVALLALPITITVAHSLVFLRGHRRLEQIRREETQARGAPPPPDLKADSGPLPAEYVSPLRLLGLPLLHVQFGRTAAGKAAVARGWIAFGNVAFGVLFAAGGIAVGGISVGGLAFGLLSLGGLAIGAVTFGGWAVGWLAGGGFALGWTAAVGGLGAAWDYAIGGMVMARHANDAVAQAYIEGHPILSLFRIAIFRMDLLMLPFLLFLPLGWAQLKKVKAAKRR